MLGLDLAVDVGGVASAEKQSVLVELQDVLSVLGGGPVRPASTYQLTDGASKMPSADREIFANEVQLIYDEVERSKIISAKDVADQLKAIWDRFELAATFKNVIPEAPYLSDYDPSNGTVQYTAKWGYYSKDNGATVSSGYDNLIAQERKISTLASKAREMAAAPPSSLYDAPTLIFQFQLNANLRQEAEIAVATEKLRQLNALIATYNDMQQLINETIASYDAGAADNQKKALIGKPPGVNRQVDTTLYEYDRVAMMFDSFRPKVSHPLETLFGIDRPQDSLLNRTSSNTGDLYGEYNTKSQWTEFNDMLSAAVTRLNQESQILTDQINSTTKKKDRHFDLGNNALAKMADMVQTVGRNIG